ncbi:EamA family transporter [Comamonas aquatica]|uniref:EamA family transporter n=1 Tax=Comamonas aquatica TaxID=225991 RepID=UPI002449308A|nr:EamA family transporter [Comamonas aquatica]MDH0496033.1 EamA family transporter [Comamonas aquatica]
MSAQRPTFLLPILAILGSIAFLCTGTSWAKHSLFPEIGAQGTTALRLGFAAALMLLFWRPWRASIARHDLRSIALYGATLGIMCLSFYLSLRTLPFGIAVAIQFAGPLSVAVWSSRRPLDYGWIALAVLGLGLGLGLGLLLPLGHDVNTLDPAGIAYAAFGAICWACYIHFGKRVGHLPISITAPLGAAVAALVVVPVGVAHAGAALLSPSVLLTGLGVALISCAIPISLELFALKHLPKHVFGTMTSMEPAVAALLALLLLGEVLSFTQCVAIALIMSASMGCALTAQARRAKPVPAVAEAA